jgi:hypothetical protein
VALFKKRKIRPRNKEWVGKETKKSSTSQKYLPKQKRVMK